MIEQDHQLPFFELFTRLRAAGLPLELRDYKDLGKALQGQFGMDPEEPDNIVAQEKAFVHLCRLLWTRTPEEEVLFNQVWTNRMRELWLIYKPIEDPQPPLPPPPPPSPQVTTSPPQPMPNPNTQVRIVSEETEEIAKEMPLPFIEPNRTSETYRPESTWFRFADDCYDLTYRQMCQAWRKLNRPTKIGVTNELDLPHTIHHYAKMGFLGKLVFQPAYRDNTQLIILADSMGSMLPFHGLSTQIIRAAQNEGIFDNEVQRYYFYNFPDKKLYLDQEQTTLVAQSDIFRNNRFNANLSVLIISDAGAARGDFNPKRVAETSFFINKLQTLARRMVWVNPMPRERWVSSSAQYIAREIQMFEASPIGFRMAIDRLK